MKTILTFFLSHQVAKYKLQLTQPTLTFLRSYVLTFFFCLLLPTSNLFAQPLTLDPEDCDPISIFPWIESFENNGTEIPPCWKRTFSFIDPIGVEWSVVPDSIGTPPTAVDGNYKMRLYNEPNTATDLGLISPKLDISVLANPVLRFWLSKSISLFGVAYKSSPDGSWKSLKSYMYGISDWQEEIIYLPNKSNYYQIGFFAANYNNILEIQLDNISIFDSDVTGSSYQVIISTNSGIEATGAEVTLTHQNGNPANIYKGISDESGIIFKDILLGIYDISITLAGHNEYIATNLIINESSLEHSAQLIETLVAPANLSVEIDDENRSALFFWELSKPCQGFTLYLDDEEIVTGVQNTEYLFTDLVSGNYKAGVKAEYLSGSSEMATISFDVLRTEEISKKHFMFSPNPVSDLLTVKCSEATKVSVSIYNSMGILVHSFETSEVVFNVNVANYNAGIYFIRLSDENKSATKCFIKQ